MLHGLKMAINGQSDRAALLNREKLATATKVISDLQQWFPRLQAAIEENNKAWSVIAYNMKNVAAAAHEIYPESHPIQPALNSLDHAGAGILRPDFPTDLEANESIASSELRDFNERLRTVHLIQVECMQTLKNKEYYAAKVEGLRRKDSEKVKPNKAERDAEKRVRNEQKLSGFAAELEYKESKLYKDLERLLVRKERVVDVAIRSFLLVQQFRFAANPITSVLSEVPVGSPQSVLLQSESRFVTGMDDDDPPVRGWVDIPAFGDYDDQPPRSPSPEMRSPRYLVGNDAPPRMEDLPPSQVENARNFRGDHYGNVAEPGYQEYECVPEAPLQSYPSYRVDSPGRNGSQLYPEASVLSNDRHATADSPGFSESPGVYGSVANAHVRNEALPTSPKFRGGEDSGPPKAQ